MSSVSSGVSGLSRPSTTFVTLPSGFATIENTLNESVWNVNVLPTASAVKISSPLSYTVYLAPGVILLSVTVNHTGWFNSVTLSSRVASATKLTTESLTLYCKSFACKSETTSFAYTGDSGSSRSAIELSYTANNKPVTVTLPSSEDELKSYLPCKSLYKASSASEYAASSSLEGSTEPSITASANWSAKSSVKRLGVAFESSLA